MTEERKVIILDGAAASDKESLHRYLRERLVLPPHYGDNLDALYDALTDIAEDTVIKLLHSDLFEQRLGWYGRQLMRVLKDAVEDNDYLKLADVKDGGIPV